LEIDSDEILQAQGSVGAQVAESTIWIFRPLDAVQVNALKKGQALGAWIENGNGFRWGAFMSIENVRGDINRYVKNASDPEESKAMINKNEIFFDGFLSAKGGLTLETNPHPLLLPSAASIDRDELAHFDWARGWHLGKFVAIEELREIKRVQILEASKNIKANQNDYSVLCKMANLSFFDGGLNRFWANRRLSKLSDAIRGSHEFGLLSELRFEVYLPFRPSEAPYEIKFFDLQKEQENAWKFVKMYGDLHGVKEATQNSVRAEIVTLMNSPHDLPPLDVPAIKHKSVVQG